MSVEDWARREAEISYPEKKKGYMVSPLRRAFREGAVHAFSALLSDEAVEAAAREFCDGTEPDYAELDNARLGLQAAINVVAEGEKT